MSGFLEQISRGLLKDFDIRGNLSGVWLTDRHTRQLLTGYTISSAKNADKQWRSLSMEVDGEIQRRRLPLFASAVTLITTDHHYLSRICLYVHCICVKNRTEAAFLWNANAETALLQAYSDIRVIRKYRMFVSNNAPTVLKCAVIVLLKAQGPQVGKPLSLNTKAQRCQLAISTNFSIAHGHYCTLVSTKQYCLACV